MWQLILSISLVVVLAVTFVVTFIWYQTIPAPKGQEKIKPDCHNCSEASCPYKEKEHD